MKYTRYKDKLLATNINTGDVKEFSSVADACKQFGFCVDLCDTSPEGDFKQHHGYTFKLKIG